MRQSIRAAFAVIAIIFFIGCAATYKPPMAVQADFTRNVDGTKEDIFNTSKQVLVLEGYQILSSDKESGIISTAQRQMDLSEKDTDCGTTMGIPYIKDKRTITKVSVGLVIKDNKITVKPTIEGEYLKGNVSQSIDLHCISSGTIEENLYAKIAQALK